MRGVNVMFFEKLGKKILTDAIYDQKRNISDISLYGEQVKSTIGYKAREAHYSLLISQYMILGAFCGWPPLPEGIHDQKT
jgi:hypothetical protein